MLRTAIECWNILKYEIKSIIQQCALLENHGKLSRKKHLSKEAIKNRISGQCKKYMNHWVTVTTFKYILTSM